MSCSTFFQDVHFSLLEKIVAVVKDCLKGVCESARPKNAGKQPHVVIVAYTCWPFWGSEPEVGWRWALAASENARVHVITRKQAEGFIKKYIDRYGEPQNVKFIIKDFPVISRFIRGMRLNRIHYFLWQFLAIGQILRINKYDPVDIVHHVTFVNIWIPALAMLLPFHTVWGPAGTNLGIPKQLKKKMGLSISERMSDTFRRFVLQRLSPINPVLLMSYIGADRIVAINPECKNLIPDRYHYKVRIAAANAVNACEVAERTHATDQIRIAYVGRLLNFKGIHFALRAFDRFLGDFGLKSKLVVVTGQNFDHASPKFTRFISGNGDPPEKRAPADRHTIRELNRLIDYAAKHKIESSIEIYGAMSPQRVLQEMKRANVLLHPSFEGGGVVVLEALSVGTPVICLNTGGPGEYVDATCGIKVEVGGYKQTIGKLANAVGTVCCDTRLWKALSEGAFERVRQAYLWSHKVRLISDCYTELMTGKLVADQFGNG